MILISLLGRGQIALRGEYGYETVIYTSDNSDEKIETPYVGEAIARFFSRQLSEVHIVGTRQAMWHLLMRHATVDVESRPTLDRETSAALAEWDQFVIEGKGNPPVEKLDAALSAFWNLPTCCHFVPPGVDAAERREVAAELAPIVKPGSEIALDITHGFRFQPMLVRDIIIAECRARQAKLKHVFYGALEMPDPETGFRPVIDLIEVLGMEQA
jgi:CRISPR-associated Csx2 family protein